MKIERHKPGQLELLPGREEPVLADSGEWRVRVSARAKRLSILVHPGGSVEVVAPRGTSSRSVHQFVAEQKSWIDSAVAASGPSLPVAQFPEHIDLPWLSPDRLEVRRERGSTGRYSRKADTLVIRAPGQDDTAAFQVLRRWVLAQGRRHLPPRVMSLGRSIRLVPRKVQVRLQKTRWGSCSCSGTISLNAAALFLEPALARYLFVHELCHLRHHNHSRDYWALVESHEPEWKTLDHRLETARHVLPDWLSRL